VPVTIDGKTVDMELDTRASVTTIPKSVWTNVQLFWARNFC